MKSIIVIGPKKTGTSALYDALKSCDSVKGNHFILNKESNYLISRPLERYQLFDRPVIDISPEYYTSFRALLKIKSLQETTDQLIVLKLKRDSYSRNNSHIDYMLNKNEISSLLIEDEIECICLSNMDLPSVVGVAMIELRLDECVDFFNKNFGYQLILNNKNPGGYTFRYPWLGLISKRVASFLRKTRSGAFLVERLSEGLRAIIYRREGDLDRNRVFHPLNDLESVMKLLATVVRRGRF